MLLAFYSVAILYTSATALVGVTTLREVSGPAADVYYSAGLTVSAVLALIGVVRTALKRRYWLELLGSLAFVAILAFYPVNILQRTLDDGQWSRLPIIGLCVLVSVVPWFRLGWLGRRIGASR